MTTCRTCQHWKPYLTGEVWGVRSFIDAPEAEQIRVQEFINRKDVDFYDLPDIGIPMPNFNLISYTPMKNWPEWGECGLAEKPDDKDSPGSLAYAMDGSDYMAVLRCHHSFGCVQYGPEMENIA